MSSFINVPVLWNETDTFCGGQIYIIEANSAIQSVTPKPAQLYPYGFQNVQYVDTVKVISPTVGTLFIDLTLEQYLALVAQASVPVGVNELTISATIGDSGFPSGTTIQDDNLIGATILLLIVNSVSVYLPSITFNISTGTITVPFALSDDDKIQINYFKA